MSQKSIKGKRDKIILQKFIFGELSQCVIIRGNQFRFIDITKLKLVQLIWSMPGMNQYEQLFSKTSKTNENEHSCIFIPGQHLFSSSELQDVCWFSTKIQQGPPDLTSKYSIMREGFLKFIFFIFETVGRKGFFVIYSL